MCLAHELVFLSSKQTGKQTLAKTGGGAGSSNTKESLSQQSDRSKSVMTKSDAGEMAEEQDEQTGHSPTEFVSLQYDITMGRLCLLNGDFALAQTHLKRAVEMDILVRQ